MDPGKRTGRFQMAAGGGLRILPDATSPNIVAGLVYSIAMNYNNRVRGSRKVGDKVFMQGGVCYNKAVPLAMASLLNQEIVVPPEPGLMGAFGVALDKAESEEVVVGPAKIAYRTTDPDGDPVHLTQAIGPGTAGGAVSDGAQPNTNSPAMISAERMRSFFIDCPLVRQWRRSTRPECRIPRT